MHAPPAVTPERQDYYDRMAPQNLAPLWERLRDLIKKEPRPRTQPVHWRYADVRPFLMESGSVISAKEAERRVLILENPGLAGQEILGRKVYASLADVPQPLDMVDIFRNSEAAGAVVDEALALPVPPKTLWMQLSVRNDAAAAAAEAEGLTVIMNRCPKIEFGRLSSEISWIGVNSRTISSKRPPAPVACRARMAHWP